MKIYILNLSICRENKLKALVRGFISVYTSGTQYVFVVGGRDGISPTNNIKTNTDLYRN